MENNFVICIQNKDYEVSLEKGKVYQVKEDTEAEKRKYLRLIDESGEDYLYPEEYFVSIQLPRAAEKALVAV